MRLSQVGGGPPEEVDRLQRSKKLLPSKFMPLFVHHSDFGISSTLWLGNRLE